ncbi:hypothetical protein L0B52_04045 [Suttonella sp. R2A3]|uniref:formyltransferase family protein n=1 Tax=Suttonella sp. R2A3 TaxID=2908648 RepID=UPI001F1B4A42|nr:formyltransferase family protein [Suttonella sp. R2A3]UJF25325.1 hypothetical protein L0B52_04045 [Suttonella sp. R2A3]
MRILLIGTVKFSYMALELLIRKNEQVVGVCTQQRSDFNSDFVDLSPLCKKNNIPFIYTSNINSPESIGWIRALEPDIIFCFGWSKLIKSELLNLTSIGVVGFHPTALPENRGRHPIIWSLILGLDQTASTFFFMEEGADDGDLLSQERVCIGYEDNALSLYNRITNIALKQIEDFLPDLKKGNYLRTPQRHELSNLWRKRTPQDGLIDFRMSSRAIYNLVRGLSEPYIGAHLLHNGVEVKIWEIEEVKYDKNNLEPGLVLDCERSLLIKCYDGAVKIIRHEFSKLPEKGEYL